MSLCYDFQKWLIISLASVALSLTIGLVTLAYGQITADEFHDKNELKRIEAYCFVHADRSANGEAVVNDLVKAGLVDSQFYNMTCSNIEQLLQTCTEAFTQRFGREPYYAYEFTICPKVEQNVEQNVGPLENFTRTARNGTQYTCQNGSNGEVIGCTPKEQNITNANNTNGEK